MSPPPAGVLLRQQAAAACCRAPDRRLFDIQVLNDQDSASKALQLLEGLTLNAVPVQHRSRLLTCRCCTLDISASEASQQLKGLLQKATTREAEQQHRQQGSVLHIPDTPPSE